MIGRRVLRCGAEGTPRVAADTTLSRFPAPRICVQDLAAGHWPVAAAVRAWNEADVVLAHGRGWGGCPDWQQIIRVRSGDYGRTGWVGWATLPRRAPDGRVIAVVRLNDHYLDPDDEWRRRVWVAAHEIGHALGRAGHASRRTASVMQTRSAYPLPTRHDLAWVDALYATPPPGSTPD